MNLYELEQYLQRVKNTGRPLSINHFPKLTVAQQQAIEIGGSGSGSVTSISHTDFMNLIGNAGLTPNSFYLVDGCVNYLYGGTTLLLQAVDASTITIEGFGKFFNPNYGNWPIWNPLNSYNIGDKVIFGISVWINLTGSVGSTTDNILNLDTDNWQQVPNTGVTDINYSLVWDYIEYDYQNDWLNARYDAVCNNLVRSNGITSYLFFCGVYPIQMFRWGSFFAVDEEGPGVVNCVVDNSYMNCLNIISGSISCVTLRNFSTMYDLNLYGNSYIYAVTLDNQSTVSGLNLTGSGFYNIELTNSSDIQSLTADNAYLQNIRLDNYGVIQNITANSCGLSNIIIKNSSQLDGCTFTNGSFNQLELTNATNFNNITTTNSNIYDISCNNSYVTAVVLNGNTIFNLTMDDGQFISYNAAGDIYNMKITGHSVNYNGITFNNQVLRATIYEYNTIKYQFNVSHDGTDNPYTIPVMYVPVGFYIEKVLVDSSDMTANTGTVPSVTLGINGVDSQAAISLSSGLFTSINNKVSCFDLSNGMVTGAKTTFGSFISGVNLNNTITSGSMDIEITLKNNNYSASND